MSSSRHATPPMAVPAFSAVGASWKMSSAIDRLLALAFGSRRELRFGLVLFALVALGTGCAAHRGQANMRVTGALYIAPGTAEWIRAEDVARTYCVDGEVLVCAASMGRLDVRRCSCPAAKRGSSRD